MKSSVNTEITALAIKAAQDRVRVGLFKLDTSPNYELRVGFCGVFTRTTITPELIADKSAWPYVIEGALNNFAHSLDTGTKLANMYQAGKIKKMPVPFYTRVLQFIKSRILPG